MVRDSPKAEGTLDASDQEILPELMSGSRAFRKKLSWSLSQECTDLDPDARPWVSAWFQSCEGDPELHVSDLTIHQQERKLRPTLGK